MVNWSEIVEKLCAEVYGESVLLMYWNYS